VCRLNGDATLRMHLCSVCKSHTTNALDDDDDDGSVA